MTTGDWHAVNMWVSATIDRRERDMQMLDAKDGEAALDELRQVKSDIAMRTLYDAIREGAERYYAAGHTNLVVMLHRPSEWRQYRSWPVEARMFTARIEGPFVKEFFPALQPVDETSRWYCEDCSVNTHSYIEHPPGPCPMRRDERGSEDVGEAPSSVS